MPDEQQKKNAVESHEIWEWHVPDPSVGVGDSKIEKDYYRLCRLPHDVPSRVWYHKQNFIVMLKR